MMKNSIDICDEFKLIKINLLDDKDSFKLLSPFKINKSLTLISNTWDWVNYSDNYKSMTIKEKSQSKINDFLGLNHLEINGKTYNIKSRECVPSNQSKGVIYSKSLLSLSDQEILKSLESQNVSDIYRFRKTLANGVSIETGSFALTFSIIKRPEYVMISFLNLEVYPLLQKPMQCKYCMLIGHTIKRCKCLHETYCKICYHRIANDQTHQCNQMCKNCHGSHLSDSKVCPAYLKESKIITLKENNQISYFDAKKLVNQNLNSSIQKQTSVNEVEKTKSERIILDTINEELKLINEEQNNTIKKLTEENRNLKQQATMATKQMEISKKLMNEILTQLKQSSQLNTNLSDINAKIQLQNDKMNITLQEYSTKLQTSHFFGSCMKKFIDKNERMAKEFQQYMELIGNENESFDSDEE